MRLKRWTCICALASIGAALIVGCGGNIGGGRTVVPITIDPAALTAPRDSKALTTHDVAVRGIAAVLVGELGLAVPERMTVYVYASREVFQQGLIEDAQISPARAAELSDFAIGVGKRRQLLFNDEGYEHRGREWLRLLAHELTHVSQIELAQGEGRAEQWLAEGMAEWVAFSVLERLGLDTIQRRRDLACAGLKSHAALVAARLDLDTLGHPRGFTVRHLREGSLPTYQLAFLMSDYLIARDGLGKVTDYYRLFGRRQNRFENFKQAFGQSLGDFEHEVLGYLKSVVH